ncbi:hypothetical protein E3N88_28315 [Mikania micrantha]|uniref:Uncharacterized protein n=1 Tax=Mikania micrantha TaxID=192012 RepID=A0A5N6N0Q7_9ASTR|nr:hypothetical protein E3N88_28315 [Mikania micrantha]
MPLHPSSILPSSIKIELSSQPLQSAEASPAIQSSPTSVSAPAPSPTSLCAFFDSTSQSLSHRFSLSRGSSPPLGPPLRRTTSTLASSIAASSHLDFI